MELLNINSVCDWFTRVATNETGFSLLEGEWAYILKALKEAGETVRPLHFGGYEGEGTRRVSIGRRQDSTVIIARGEWAETLAEECLVDDGRYTRADFAVTLELEKPESHVAAMAYHEGSWPVTRRGCSYFPTLTVNFAGGQTFYVGNRSQAYLLRIYDKGVQQGTHGEGHLWRYEVQANRTASVKAVATMRKNWQNRAKTVQSWVYDVFMGYGVCPIFERSGDYQTAMGISMKRYDPETTLAWYRGSVAPSISRLLAAGYEEQVRKALGLSTQLSFLEEV